MLKKEAPYSDDWNCVQTFQPKKEFEKVFASHKPEIAGVKTAMVFESGI